MNVQPKPSPDCLPGARMGADGPHARGHLLALVTKSPTVWPVQLEVEPWRP